MSVDNENVLLIDQDVEISGIVNIADSSLTTSKILNLPEQLEDMNDLIE